jgi:hypothetical protein
MSLAVGEPRLGISGMFFTLSEGPVGKPGLSDPFETRYAPVTVR